MISEEMILKVKELHKEGVNVFNAVDVCNRLEKMELKSLADNIGCMLHNEYVDLITKVLTN